MSRKHTDRNKHQGKPRRGRSGQGGQTWIYGRHAVAAALANPKRQILRLVATQEMAADVERMEAERNLPLVIEKMERTTIDRLLEFGAVHQGVAAQVAPLPDLALDEAVSGADIVVVLDQVVDPHNVGAILRSCAAFGVGTLIMQDRHSPAEAGSLAKAASGALEWVPIARVTNISRALEQLKNLGFWIAGLDGEADHELGGIPLQAPLALVMGAEGDGLRRLTREACDHLLAIPSARADLSLNVSNAAAVALYEARRSISA
jgi:23S rRNA (guanosine2251-2'-O)-methyltransferase